MIGFQNGVEAKIPDTILPDLARVQWKWPAVSIKPVFWQNVLHIP
jgi:hypothetical protein